MRLRVPTGAACSLHFAMCLSPKWSRLILCKFSEEQPLLSVANILGSLLHLNRIYSLLSLKFSKGYFTCQLFPVIWLHGINWRVGPLFCHAGGSQWSLSNTRAQSALGPPQLITSMAEKEPVSLLPTAIIYSKLKLTPKIFPNITLNTQFNPILSPTQAPKCTGQSL